MTVQSCLMVFLFLFQRLLSAQYPSLLMHCDVLASEKVDMLTNMLVIPTIWILLHRSLCGYILVVGAESGACKTEQQMDL